MSGNDTSTGAVGTEGNACEAARRAAMSRSLDYCGSREEKMRSTARMIGVTGEVDCDAAFDGPATTPEMVRQLALCIMWNDNDLTGSALAEKHDVITDALDEAWAVADSRFDPEPVSDEETAEAGSQGASDDDGAVDAEGATGSDDGDEADSDVEEEPDPVEAADGGGEAAGESIEEALSETVMDDDASEADEAEADGGEEDVEGEAEMDDPDEGDGEEAPTDDETDESDADDGE